MGPRPVPSLDELKASCGQFGTLAMDFIDLLGLPVKKDSPKSGRPTFDDNNGAVTKLYERTSDIITDLVKRYNYSTKELRKSILPEPSEFLLEITREILSSYGQSIWRASEPYLTQINLAYPRHLSLAKPEDREIIEKLLYYWIVHRALCSTQRREKRTTILGTTRKAKLDSALRNTGLRGTEIESSSPVSDMEEDDIKPPYGVEVSEIKEVFRYTPDIRQEGSWGCSQHVGIHVAQMLPQPPANMTSQLSNPKTVSGTPFGRPQPKISAGLQAAQAGAASSDSNREDSKSDTIVVRRDSLQSTKKASQVPSPNKRKSKLNETRANKRANMSNPHGKTSTSRQLLPQESARIEGTRPVSLLTSSTPSHDGAGSLSVMRCGINPTEQGTSSGGVDGDGRSLQDIRDEENMQDHVATDDVVVGPALPGNSPSLIVVLKLRYQEGAGTLQESETTSGPLTEPQIQESQLDREKFTLDVFKLLRAFKSGHHDTEALSNTVTYLRRIVEDSPSMLVESSGDSFETHQAALHQWLGLVDRFIDFRRVTAFNGDRHEWNAFHASLEPVRKDEVMLAFFETRLSMTELRKQTGVDFIETSKKVAEVLHSLASWDSMMEKADLEGECARFNTSLLEWFQPVANQAKIAMA